MGVVEQEFRILINMERKRRYKEALKKVAFYSEKLMDRF